MNEFNFFQTFQLGLVEVSNSTIIILSVVSLITFSAVGISSYKLLKSLTSKD